MDYDGNCRCSPQSKLSQTGKRVARMIKETIDPSNCHFLLNPDSLTGLLPSTELDAGKMKREK